MGFRVITPPKAEEQIANEGKRIIDASHRLGAELDVEGFLLSWLNGTRVVVEEDNDGVIVSVCMFSAGERWNAPGKSAHVLVLEGNIEPTLDFVKTLCQAMGVATLFCQRGKPEEVHEDHDVFIVDAWSL